MARDPQLPLTDVQWVLGHAHLSTTQLYLTPMPGDVIAEVLAHHRRVEHSGSAAGDVPDGADGVAAPSGYRRDSLDVCSGGGHHDRARPGPAQAPPEPAQTTAAAAVIGPDMTQLWRRFPPRISAPTWPATEQTREVLPDRLLAAPFTLTEDRVARARRRLGLIRLLGWLAEHPGDMWQQRWLACGADAVGDAEWWRPLLAWARPRNPLGAVSTSSNLRACALLLVGADVVRPSLEWVLTPRVPQSLVTVMARARDPHGFTELSALCAASPAGRTLKNAALRRKAVSSSIRARLFVAAACTDWHLDALRDDAVIISSELVANAVLHARTECRLTTQLDARGLTIAVQDYRPGRIRRPSVDATNLRGLGLFVVDRLSRSWGTSPTADGKKVWALLPTPASPTERRSE